MEKLICKTHCFLTLLLFFGLWQVTIAQNHIHSLDPDTQPIHLRVVFQQNPANEVTISWTTTGEGTSSIVYYDTEPRDGDVNNYANKNSDVRIGSYTLLSEEEEAGMNSWYHHTVIEDLEPSTTYYIMVETDGDRTDEYHFVTAAGDDRKVAILVGGDSRVGDQRTDPENPRRQMFKVMSDLVEENPHILAFASTADYTNRAYWSQLYYWLKDYTEMTTTRDGRLLPIVPSRGNHDTDVGFEEKFNWPGDGRDSYYTSHLSEDVALIALNSTISLRGDQREWLEDQLAELRPQKRWIMPFYHHPAYPSVRSYASGQPRRGSWVPLFEEYNVDIVAEGHDHALKRTVPILRNEVDPRGIVYIGDGGLGVSPRVVVEQRWYLQEPGMTISMDNVHLLEFSSDALNGRGFDNQGEVADEFYIPADRQERIEYFESQL